MAEIKIAGITRASAYSPNHIGNDAAIFNIVADQLRKRGCEVTLYTEEQLAAREIHEDIIVNMCREARSIALLQRLEDEGRLVINSGYGIENCTRERMTRILMGCNIPYPPSLMVNTDERVRDELVRRGFRRCWIKRGDGHAMHREDVSFARHPEEAQEILQEYFMRGIHRAVINLHLEGDLVKFYGIRGSNYFSWFYPFETHQSKFGNESVNGVPENVPFDKERLRKICDEAADVLDVVVYGGDCIISPEGDIQIIDFNDWPSFAPCRNEAGPQIARRIMAIIKERAKEHPAKN